MRCFEAAHRLVEPETLCLKLPNGYFVAECDILGLFIEL